VSSAVLQIIDAAAKLRALRAEFAAKAALQTVQNG